MEATLSLVEILLIIKQRWKLIVLITMVGFVSTALVTYFLLTPMYESSTLLLVNKSQNQGENNSNSDALSDKELIKTYSVIITTPRILEEVVKELSLKDTHHILKERVVVDSERDSQVFSIKVKYEDAEMAMNLANTIATIFQREIYEIMNVDNVSILSTAEIPQTPVSPKPVLNLTIAFVVSFMISIGITFLLEFADNRIKTEEDIEKSLGVPMLGTVMSIDPGNRKLNRINHSKKNNLQERLKSEVGEKFGS